LFQDGGKSIQRQVAGVGRCLGQTAYGLNQFFATQLPGFGHCFTLQHFGEHGGASHGGNASLGEKSDVFDSSGRHAQSKFQDISAGRIFNLGGGVRIDDCARVARILEVIEDLR